MTLTFTSSKVIKLKSIYQPISLDRSDFPVSIVGAGPAGLMAGLTLSKRNVDSIVLEKSNYIGHPVHTSGGSWIQDLKDLGIPSHLYNPIKNATFLSNNSRAEFRLDEATACVIRVREMLQYLALEHASNGGDLLIGANVKSVENTENGTRVKYYKNGEEKSLDSRFTIDGSGFSTVTNRTITPHNTWHNFGYGVEYESWVENLEKDTVTLMVGSDYSKFGYAWIFPTGEHRARFGSGFLRAGTNESPQKMVDKFIRSNPMIQEEFGKIVPIEIHSGVVPADGTVEESVLGRVLLAGDSAGQVTPHIGEGIRFALKFGKLAAGTVADALRFTDGEKIKAVLSGYDREWKSDIGAEFKRALALQEKIFEFSDEQWDKAVEGLKELSNKQFVSFLRGDFSGRYLFSLLMTHPSLVRKLIS